jgi:hypothetical protein
MRGGPAGRLPRRPLHRSALFAPCTPPHVIVFADTVVNVFLEKQWHCGAHRLSAVNATAAEDSIVAGRECLGADLIA